jgi:hypothetical protein
VVNAKNKKSQVPAIRREDFEAITHVSAECVGLIAPVLYLNKKFSDIFQVKNVQYLLQEVSQR